MTENDLLDSIRRGSAMHALLISGPNKSGRAALARKAAAIYCLGSGQTEQLDENPNFSEICPDEKGQIKLDPVREMNKQAAMQSVSGGKRAFLISDAHLMNANAQNAILKTLEEAPADTFFILEGAEEPLLPTIKSRCAVWRVESMRFDALADELRTRGIEPKRAAYAARVSDGLLDKAVLYCTEAYAAFAEAFGNVFDAALYTPSRPFSGMRKLLETEYFEVPKPAKKSKKPAAGDADEEDPDGGNSGKKLLARKNADFALEMTAYELRDALLIKEKAGDLCGDASARAKRLSEQLSERGLLALSAALQSASRDRSFDADPVKTMDLMLLSLKEAEREKA